jgi:predicted RNase H-like HicB family nuclease
MTDADVRGYRLEMYRDPEDGSWVAEVPDLPGCVAGGETAEEAVEMVADAIEAWVEAASANRRAVPLPRPVDDEYSGRFLLRVTRRLHAQLARAARREGVSLNAYCSTALAESIGADETRQAFVTTRFAALTALAEQPASTAPSVRVTETAALFQIVGEHWWDVKRPRTSTTALPAMMQPAGKEITQ